MRREERGGVCNCLYITNNFKYVRIQNLFVIYNHHIFPYISAYGHIQTN